MSRTTDFDRLARTWLEDGPTALSDRTLDAALTEIHLTRQRRVPRVPWRFQHMPALSRATGVAAVVLVAALSAGGLVYLNVGGPGGPGGSTPPTATAAPTPVSTLPPGIPGWTTYTSAIYGFTMAYPSDWSVNAVASEKCPERRGLEDGTPCAEEFVSPQSEDGLIGLWVWQVPVPQGANLGSAEGLQAAFSALCESTGAESCEPAFAPKPLCGEAGDCRPGITTLIGEADKEIPHAFVAGPQPGFVTVLMIGREDTYPAAARYGGSVALLTAIARQVGIQSP